VVGSDKRPRGRGGGARGCSRRKGGCGERSSGDRHNTPFKGGGGGEASPRGKRGLGVGGPGAVVGWRLLASTSSQVGEGVGH
jgi:hypothetical protein